MTKNVTESSALSFRVSKELSKKLDRTAAANNATKTQIINTALTQYLGREDDIGILYRDLRRLHNRVDDVKKSADLSSELMIMFVKSFYRFIELYQGDNNREFKKEAAFEKYLDDVMNVMLTQGLFSAQLDRREKEIVDN